MPRKDTIPAPRTDTYGSRQRPGTRSGQEMVSRPHQRVVSCVKELSEPGKWDGSGRADVRAGWVLCNFVHRFPVTDDVPGVRGQWRRTGPAGSLSLLAEKRILWRISCREEKRMKMFRAAVRSGIRAQAGVTHTGMRDQHKAEARKKTKDLCQMVPWRSEREGSEWVEELEGPEWRTGSGSGPGPVSQLSNWMGAAGGSWAAVGTLPFPTDPGSRVPFWKACLGSARMHPDSALKFNSTAIISFPRGNEKVWYIYFCRQTPIFLYAWEVEMDIQLLEVFLYSRSRGRSHYWRKIELSFGNINISSGRLDM